MSFSLRKLFVPSFLVATGIFLPCCAPVTQETRIEEHQHIYQGLSEKEKSLVREGKIDAGMSKGAVFLSWGKADRETDLYRDNKRTTRWDYTKLTPIYSNRIHGGVIFGHHAGYRRCRSHGYWGGWDGYGDYMGIGTSVHYRKTNAASVFFENEKVSAWEVEK